MEERKVEKKDYEFGKGGHAGDWGDRAGSSEQGKKEMNNLLL